MADRYTRVNRALPNITNLGQLQQYMATWLNSITRALRRPVPPPPPQNFKATNARGGIQLTWTPANLVATHNAGVISSPGAPDGYEIVKSLSGNFMSDVTVIPIRDPAANTYFDSVGGVPTTASYRIRTTAGTPTSAYSQHGPEGGVVKHTSIDSNDTVTVPTSKIDNYTNDAVRATASRGRYGAFLQ
jgi:hypothetical protein